MDAYGPLTRNVKTRTIGMMDIRVGSSAAFISQNSPILTPQNSLGAMATTTFTGTREVFEFTSGTPTVTDGTVVLSEIAQIDAAFLEKKPYLAALASGINPLVDVPASVSGIGTSTVSGTMSGNISADAVGSVDDTWMVTFDDATSGAIQGINTGLVHTFSDLISEMAPINIANPYFTIPANFFSGTWALGETYTFSTTAFVSGTSSYANDYEGEVPLGLGKASDFFRIEGVVSFPMSSHKMVFILPKAQVVSSLTFDFAQGGEGNTPVMFKANQATSLTDGGHAVWDNAPLGKIVWIA